MPKTMIGATWYHYKPNEPALRGHEPVGRLARQIQALFPDELLSLRESAFVPANGPMEALADAEREISEVETHPLTLPRTVER